MPHPSSLVWKLGALLALWTHLSEGAVVNRGITTDPAAFANTKFDFLVLGGGTAGLTVAARLAEKYSVGVIEAGQYRPNDPIIDVPKNFGAAVGNPTYDWIYATTPQPNVNNRSIRHPRGKVLGGSSAINFEIFNRPAKPEYSAWSVLNIGQGDWSWDGLLPYFKKTETYTPALAEDKFPNPTPTKRSLIARDDNETSVAIPFFESADSALTLTGLNLTDLLAAAGIDTTSVPVQKRTDAVHGSSGPVNASHNTWYSDLASPYIHTLQTLGIDVNQNPDSGDNVGTYNSPHSVNPSAGVRSYAAPAYYAPNANKPSLLVLTGAQTSKLTFGAKDRNGNYAVTGVTFSYNSVNYAATAKKEVVISQGVFGTPQLLELSGIGKGSFLRTKNITPVIELPGVGENLQDHQMAPVSFIINPGVHTWDELRNNATFAAAANAQYQSTHTGILTSTIGTVSFFPLQSFLSPLKIISLISSVTSELLNSSQSFSLLQWAQYVIQLAWLANQDIPQVELVLIPGFNPTGTVVAPAPNTTYMVISPVVQHPFSRGSVHIISDNPNDKPAINPNYLSSIFDRTVLLESVKYIREKIATTSPLKDYIQAFNDPPASWTSDDQLANYTRLALESLKHPVGTAAMAPQALGGVVDSNLLVYGTTNLRIVDASIFPMHVSAHAQTTTYAIAEKAADFIKSRW